MSKHHGNNTHKNRTGKDKVDQRQNRLTTTFKAQQSRADQQQVAKHNPYNPNIEKIMERLASSSLFGSDTSLGAKIILALMINELFINVANNVGSSVQPKTSPKRSEKKEQKRAEAEQRKTVAEEFQEFASANLSLAAQNEVLDNFEKLSSAEQNFVTNFTNHALHLTPDSQEAADSLEKRFENFFTNIFSNIMAKVEVAFFDFNEFEIAAIESVLARDKASLDAACQKAKTYVENEYLSGSTKLKMLGVEYLKKLHRHAYTPQNIENLKAFHAELAKEQVRFDLEEILNFGDAALLDLLIATAPLNEALHPLNLETAAALVTYNPAANLDKVHLICKLLNADVKISQPLFSPLKKVLFSSNFLQFVYENQIPLAKTTLDKILPFAINRVLSDIISKFIDISEAQVFDSGLSVVDAINIVCFIQSHQGEIKDAKGQTIPTTENDRSAAVAKFILGSYFFLHSHGRYGDFFSAIIGELMYRKVQGFESIYENYSLDSDQSSAYERQLNGVIGLINRREKFLGYQSQNVFEVLGHAEILVEKHKVYYVIERDREGRALNLYHIDGNPFLGEERMRGAYHPGVYVIDVSKISPKDLKKVTSTTITFREYIDDKKRVWTGLKELDPDLKITPQFLTRAQMLKNCTRKTHDLLVEFILEKRYGHHHQTITQAEALQNLNASNVGLDEESDSDKDVLRPHTWYNEGADLLPGGDARLIYEKFRSRLVGAALGVVKGDVKFMEKLQEEVGRDIQKEEVLTRFLQTMIPETAIKPCEAEKSGKKPTEIEQEL